MIKHPDNKDTEQLLNIIVEALLAKKGLEIKSISLGKLIDPVCEYFIICSGDSNTHVYALADSVLEDVKEKTGEYVWHKEGYENGQWILLDYSNIVVHVFQDEFRSFYNLEGLWADAEMKEHKDE